MSIFRVLILLFPFTLLLSCNPVKSTADAGKAVSEFHSLYNSEDFDQIYDTAHTDFKTAQPKEEAISFFRGVREKLGAVKKSTRQGVNLFSGNSGTTATVTYMTEFENGSGTEVFSYRLKDGKTTLIQWNINSRDLITSPSENSKSSPAKE